MELACRVARPVPLMQAMHAPVVGEVEERVASFTFLLANYKSHHDEAT